MGLWENENWRKEVKDHSWSIFPAIKYLDEQRSNIVIMAFALPVANPDISLTLYISQQEPLGVIISEQSWISAAYYMV